MATLNIKRHDTRSAIRATLKTPGGSVVDLTDALVKFTMTKYGTVVVSRDAEVLDELGGVVCFIFTADETSDIGPMKAEFEVTYPDGSVETFPNSGYIDINIEADLA